MNMRKWTAGIFAVSMLLTGCGTDTEDSSNTSPTTGKEYFTVGMECNYAPFNWQTSEQTDTSVALEDGAGYCDGYDVRVARELADQLGREIQVKKIAWKGLQPALESGDIDAIIAGMTADPVRENGIDFTSPYYESEMVMIVRKADKDIAKYTDIQQFKGKMIIGQLGTNYDTVIDQIKGVKHATAKESYPEMVVALQNKDVDGITAELPVAEGVVATNDDLVIVRFDEGKGFTVDTSVSIGLKEGSRGSEFFNEVEKALQSISTETRNEWMSEANTNQPSK